jgi:hypothetical protein
VIKLRRRERRVDRSRVSDRHPFRTAANSAPSRAAAGFGAARSPLGGGTYGDSKRIGFSPIRRGPKGTSASRARTDNNAANSTATSSNKGPVEAPRPNVFVVVKQSKARHNSCGRA